MFKKIEKNKSKHLPSEVSNPAGKLYIPFIPESQASKSIYGEAPDKHPLQGQKTLFWLFLLLILWQVVSTLIWPKAKLNASDLTVQNILSAVSTERRIRNLNELSTDYRLSSAAQFKSDDMMNRRYFSHTNPEGDYIWDKITQSGYSPYLQLGENLAIEFYNTESLVSAWMNSPSHRANILNEGFKDQGMGLAFGRPDEGQYYSSIANTFGALLPVKSKPLPVPSSNINSTNSGGLTEAPLPAKNTTTQTSLSPLSKSSLVQKKPIDAKPKNTPPESQPQSQTTKTSSSTTTLTSPPIVKNQKSQPEALRSSIAENNQVKLSQNYALPPLQKASATEPYFMGTEPIIQPVGPQKYSVYKINRYVMLVVGLILLIMIINDLKIVFREKFLAYDKKINNLVLLILSIIVVGLMYWL